eukprot:scaffold6303_cov75-Phaeocystis_antarctica.AAC.3
MPTKTHLVRVEVGRAGLLFGLWGQGLELEVNNTHSGGVPSTTAQLLERRSERWPTSFTASTPTQTVALCTSGASSTNWCDVSHSPAADPTQTSYATTSVCSSTALYHHACTSTPAEMTSVSGWRCSAQVALLMLHGSESATCDSVGGVRSMIT